MTPVRHSRRHTAGAALMFASNGAMLAALLPWYPALVREWGLSEVQFGLIVAAMPVGSLASSVLPARVVARWGPSAAVIGGTAVMAALISAVGWIGGGAALALILFFFGIVDATSDVGQNVVGTRVQERAGKSVISTLHACWSLGATVSGALATVSASTGVPLRVHLAVAAAVSLAMAVAGTRLTGRASDVPVARAALSDETAPTGRAIWPVFTAVLPLAIVAIAGTSVEDAGQNWAGLASVELAGVAVASAGVAYAVFLTAQTLGRFAGDRMIDAFGRARVAAAGGALIAVGGALVVFAGAPAPLIAGFALAGFGCATLVPSAFAAAAALPGLSDGAGVTLVGWLMRLGFLATSPAIGAVATGAGLSVALGILVILGVVVMACAPALRERA